jgi:hypothetical protein
MKLWQRVTLLTISVASAGSAVLFACSNSTSSSSSPCNTSTAELYKVDASTVFRAKLQLCRTGFDGDCTNQYVTPRCASSQYAWCDSTQDAGAPQGYGICVFELPPQATPNSTCVCYEGDIRYCDLQGWGSCSQSTRWACGIQMCIQASDSGTLPAPAWGVCTPQVAPPIDAGPTEDAGSSDDAAADDGG